MRSSLELLARKKPAHHAGQPTLHLFMRPANSPVAQTAPVPAPHRLSAFCVGVIRRFFRASSSIEDPSRGYSIKERTQSNEGRGVDGWAARCRAERRRARRNGSAEKILRVTARGLPTNGRRQGLALFEREQ
jgi:hypothetical protein